MKWCIEIKRIGHPSWFRFGDSPDQVILKVMKFQRRAHCALAGDSYSLPFVVSDEFAAKTMAMSARSAMMKIPATPAHLHFTQISDCLTRLSAATRICACGRRGAHVSCSSCLEHFSGIDLATHRQTCEDKSCKKARALQIPTIYTYGAKLAQSFLARISMGKELTEKQLAVLRDYQERSFADPPADCTSVRPAIMCVTPRMRGWTSFRALVERDAYVFLEAYWVGGRVKFARRLDTKFDREEKSVLRRLACEILEERTGYHALATLAEYQDAFLGARGDSLLGRVILILAETHSYFVKTGRLVEPASES